VRPTRRTSGIAVFRTREFDQRFALMTLRAEGLDQPFRVPEGHRDEREIFHYDGVVNEPAGDSSLAFQQIDDFPG
jgi:hypothetical protein